MESAQLTALRRQLPFRPFQIRLSDGRVLEVVHPELILVGPHDVTIGFPRKNSDKPYFFEHKTTIDLSDIRGIDFLETKGATAQPPAQSSNS